MVHEGNKVKIDLYLIELFLDAPRARGVSRNRGGNQSSFLEKKGFLKRCERKTRKKDEKERREKKTRKKDAKKRRKKKDAKKKTQKKDGQKKFEIFLKFF